MITILGAHMPQAQAIQFLGYLLWIRYSLDTIGLLSQTNRFRAWTDKPYEYMATTMPVTHEHDFYSARLAAEDHIAIRHTSMFSNLEPF
jgi:hypothetical protein